MGNLARKRYERDTQSCMLRQAFNRIISPCIIWIAVAGFGLAGLVLDLRDVFSVRKKEEFRLESCLERIWKWCGRVFQNERIRVFWLLIPCGCERIFKGLRQECSHFFSTKPSLSQHKFFCNPFQWLHFSNESFKWYLNDVKANATFLINLEQMKPKIVH